VSHAHSTVYDLNHQPQILGDKLAQGGEGEIYPLRDRPEVLLKRYHPAHLARRGAALQAKIEAMRSLAPLRQDRNLAWPLIHAFDEQRNWVGYCMYRGKGVPMFKLAHALLYQKHFPGLDRRRLVGYLCALTSQVQALHAQQVMVGDYNLNNFLCDPDSDAVSFIDCDSYQIRIAGRHYPCPVGSADMTAKEQQNQPFEQLVRTPQSEAFSLAIILFKVLMLGRHPYDIVGGDDPVQNLCRGDFAYGTGNRGIPRGHWYNIWSHMPHRLKTLFIQTFSEGADHPERRPTPAEWHEALSLYRREMDKGWHATDIKPPQPKPQAYRGSRSHA
jgi:DNA-binding helix-hairpin-helix protein with protein kinase domain